MNRDLLVTAGMLLGAIALAVAASLSAPESRTPSVFSDQGEALFALFRDVNAAKTIEVIEYNPADAVARPLKVEFRKGKWVLASHYDYPAEARDRLAKTAAALVDLKKDLVVSDRIEDHGKYGVIDPLDAKVAALTGRGKRITLRDASGAVLVDAILGEAVKERQGYRYLRLPGQKRVYSVKTEADPSARFEDWVEADILRAAPASLRAINVVSYQISEQMGGITNLERTTLTSSGGEWRVEGATAKPAAVQALVNTLARLRAVGVRPKPPELARQLRERGTLELSLEAMLSLRQRGFFLTPQGRLLANDGEISVETDQGVLYSLRFGDIVTSQEGQPVVKDPAKAVQENRYLFATASFDPARAAKYGTAGGNGEQTAQALSARFADWYYVISGADFSRLRPKRAELLK